MWFIWFSDSSTRRRAMAEERVSSSKSTEKEGSKDATAGVIPVHDDRTL